MNRILLALAALSLVAGCGRAAMELDPQTAATEPAPRIKVPLASEDPTDGLETAAATDTDATPARATGDFVVYKFTGSFRNKPLTLTERVVAKKGDTILIDFLAEEGATKQELLVKMSDAAGKKNEVIAVSKIEGGKVLPSNTAAFEALMQKTMLAADQNEAVVANEDVTLDVAGKSLPCHKTTFRVKVGKKAATMHTIESQSFAWGDVGGDITTEKGKTLYKAEVVEIGHEDLPIGAPIANGDLDE